MSSKRFSYDTEGENRGSGFQTMFLAVMAIAAGCMITFQATLRHYTEREADREKRFMNTVSNVNYELDQIKLAVTNAVNHGNTVVSNSFPAHQAAVDQRIDGLKDRLEDFQRSQSEDRALIRKAVEKTGTPK